MTKFDFDRIKLDPHQEKLDPAKKAAWCKALRSKEYKQGQNRLRIGNGFCCIGVKADLELVRTGKALWITDLYDLTEYYLKLSAEKDDEVAYLPETYGLTYKTQDILGIMNDSGVGFRRIADWIEENL